MQSIILRELLRNDSINPITPINRITSGLSSRYFNRPPLGGYRVDEEEEYLPQDNDDISSTLMLEIITNFGSPEIEMFMKNIKRKQIKTIGKSKKVKPETDICQETCPICIDEFKPNELYRNLTCGHQFHKKCIDRWFRKDHSDCPMCRQSVI
jgi:hypothetical protein